MRLFRLLGVAAVVSLAAFLMIAPGADAVTLRVCVPEKEGAPLVTPKAGVCKAKYAQTTLLPEAVASHINYVEKGVGGKPTIQLSGVNVQIVNGEGKTNAAVNGEGNLVIGYDENAGKHEQTGSHNLILAQEQTFTSFGGILGGYKNTVTAPYASVSGGYANLAEGELSSVTGGLGNLAASAEASVSGGDSNVARDAYASVSGGSSNVASEVASSVGGGYNNVASGLDASVSGGESNYAGGVMSSVSGGAASDAGGPTASITGGFGNVIPSTAGAFATIFGGKELAATKEYEAIP